MIASYRLLLPTVVAAFLSTTPAILQANEIYAADGVAINGYDPVAYFTERKPIKGNPEFVASHKGSNFHFSSQGHRDAFIRSPERYTPQYGGYCAYGLARGYKATTQPQAFTIVDDKLYLNYSDEVMATWRSDTAGYIKKADANWPGVKDDPAP
ncbi:tat pathway signal sequence domain protein (plasmid) [Aliirhizobium terrae]|uniref:YHS domain-containing (seleno)protein n=1 Tax=Terrirhizobium terrae TaxID=2926709 RepID=UPI0025768F8F|nr:YHS domain-containing (seleno)protein [Rhizobium sp. CC-CFT758]WJH38799.1 tat pathway signal sequence domain protein [Rhizobium sp. CC-CFT758]